MALTAGKSRTLTRALISFALVLGIVVSGVITASPASASTCRTPSYSYGWRLPTFEYICEYGYTEVTYDNRGHFFLVGNEGAIWHTWQTEPGGPWHSRWVSLGGYGLSRIAAWEGTTSGRRWVTIQVLSHGGWQCKTYNKQLGGAWWPSQSSWSLSPC